MITLYGFGTFSPIIGKTRDLRVEWALQEMELPYEVHGLDFTKGDQRSVPFRKISPFNLVPAIDDDGFGISESGSILLYLAEKSGKLIPSDFKEKHHVIQWCFSTLSTVERKFHEIFLMDRFSHETADIRKIEILKKSNRWLSVLDNQLADQEWIAYKDFTIADILLASVLRSTLELELLTNYSNLNSYFVRAFERPAWQRTLSAYSQRMGVPISEI